jgi:hypothetical protein
MRTCAWLVPGNVYMGMASCGKLSVQGPIGICAEHLAMFLAKHPHLACNFSTPPASDNAGPVPGSTPPASVNVGPPACPCGIARQDCEYHR